MPYINFNPNPDGNRVGDCVIRAISKALDISWDQVYAELAIQGFMMKNMPSSNNVWGSYLKSKGFRKYHIPNDCPDCYTVNDFCEDHPSGVYILATGDHTVTVIDGCYYDTFDSGDESPIYFFSKEGQAI